MTAIIDHVERRIRRASAFTRSVLAQHLWRTPESDHWDLANLVRKVAGSWEGIDFGYVNMRDLRYALANYDESDRSPIVQLARLVSRRSNYILNRELPVIDETIREIEAIGRMV